MIVKKPLPVKLPDHLPKPHAAESAQTASKDPHGQASRQQLTQLMAADQPLLAHLSDDYDRLRHLAQGVAVDDALDAPHRSPAIIAGTDEAGIGQVDLPGFQRIVGAVKKVLQPP